MSASRPLLVVQEQLAEAVAARKCHSCGCLHKTVEALSGTDAGRAELAPVLAQARGVFIAKQYDCLGCPTCYPAIAANAFAEQFPEVGAGLDLCPVEEPEQRKGWPPLPGDYRVIRYGAPVAVCTLNSDSLMVALERAAPAGLALVGTLHTENLGIERIVRNILANPHIRFLIICGNDTEQAVGHLPGKSMLSLFKDGVDERGRIRNAPGKRPVLKNVSVEQIAAFVAQVTVVPLVGELRSDVIRVEIERCAATKPGIFTGAPQDSALRSVLASEPMRLVQDPAGFLVVYPERDGKRLVVEHYTNQGVLDAVIEGASSAAVYATIIERGLISRLDHAAYLGRELARAERSLETGEPYVQDRAAGEEQALEQGCGCAAACGTGARA